MKAYKGFNKDMTCRGFQYAEGQTYETDAAELCESGFHACLDPLDTFNYYEPAKSVYHEVELEDVSEERSIEDSKVVGKRIKIGAALDVAGLCKAKFEFVKEHCTNEHNAEPGKPATAGYAGAATAGNRGAATSRGKSSVGANGIACARGNSCRVRGGLGAVLVVGEENANDYDLIAWKAVVVDGKTIKADTWYKLDNGELVEVADGET